MAFFDWFTGERPVLVQQTFEDIVDMVDRGRDMFLAATGRLLDNEILDMDLEAMDESINHREQHCRSTALEYISSSPGNQLILVLKLLSIVQEAERIGDLAKSLGAMADLADAPRLGRHVKPLRDIRNRIATFFELTLEAFRTDDIRKAEEVLRRHQGVKDDVEAYVQTLGRDDSATVNEAVVYALAARMLGRTSSHLANIASTVVFPFEQIRRTHPEGDEL
jgi:phosphate uptake regulator